MIEMDQGMVMKKRTVHFPGIMPDHNGKIPDEFRLKERDESCFFLKSLMKGNFYRLFTPRPP